MGIPTIHHGSAIALIVTIVLGAFISEDGATITAATLAASSVLDFRLAFLSAFAGLWGGELGVYALTRNIGGLRDGFRRKKHARAIQVEVMACSASP